jgi:hypothetical protein
MTLTLIADFYEVIAFVVAVGIVCAVLGALTQRRRD